MKKVLIGIGVLVALGGTYLYVKNQTALLGQLDFEIVDKKITSISLDKVVLEVTFKIINKSKIDMRIDGYDIQLTSNKKPVARLISEKKQTIAANSSSTITLKAAAASSQVLGTALSADILSGLIGDKSKVVIGIKGTISGFIGNAISVKNFPINITAPLSNMLLAKK